MYKQNLTKKIILVVYSLAICYIIHTLVLAQQNQSTPNTFFIIPEQESSQALSAVQNILDTSQPKSTVWDRYNKQADLLEGSLGNQFATGIMTRNTLINYIIYVVRFISQIGLVIGAVMIIYAGYIYATGVFRGADDGASRGNAAIRYAIQGIVVIACSYAIMRILISAFLS